MVDSIWVGAVYGGIGALAGFGVGTILGGIVTAVAKNGRSGLVAMGLSTLAGVAGAFTLGKPLLDDHVGAIMGRGVVENVGETIDAIFAEISEDPMMAAILDREPELKNVLRRRMRRTLATAPSHAAARSELYALSSSTVGGRLVHYVQRGQDADITAFMTELTSTLSGLFDTDPDFCHQYLYRNAELVDKTTADLREIIGPDQFDRLQGAAAAVVRGAGQRIPDYSQASATVIVDEAFEVMQGTLGDSYAGLITGESKPANVSEAKVACWATVQYYTHMLRSDDPALPIRHVFLTAG